MPLHFQPQSDESLMMDRPKFELLKPEQYEFVVIEAMEKKSAKGNDMILLKLKVKDSAGRERFVWDNLMPQMMHKLKHFCDFNQLSDEYKYGILSSEMCYGKNGVCLIDIQKNKDTSEDVNYIKDYLQTENIETKNYNELNDTIPF